MKKINYLALLLFTVFSCKTEVSKQFSEEALNDSLITLNGESISFKDILKSHEGKTVLIDVWASWCKDCIEGMPKVEALQAEFTEVAYVFLSLDKSEDSWKKGIEKYDVKGAHYFMASGKKSPLGSFINIDWIPRYMVLDKAGNIVLFKAIEADDPKLIEALKK